MYFCSEYFASLFFGLVICPDFDTVDQLNNHTALCFIYEWETIQRKTVKIFIVLSTFYL